MNEKLDAAKSSLEDLIYNLRAVKGNNFAEAVTTAHNLSKMGSILINVGRGRASDAPEEFLRGLTHLAASLTAMFWERHCQLLGLSADDIKEAQTFAARMDEAAEKIISAAKEGE